jgi:hypothetical protein
MSIQLDARLRQKADTETNWLANPLLLLSGEMAIVVDGTGAPINFKMGAQTSNKAFVDLPYLIDYASTVVVASIADGGTLPAPASSGKIMILPAGTYHQPVGGGADLVLAANTFNVIFWSVPSWVVVISIVVSVDLSSYSLKAPVDALALTVNGGDLVVSTPTDALSTYTTNYTSTSTTFFNNKPFIRGGALKQIKIWCTTAGNVSVRIGHKTGSSVTVYNTAITLVCALGLNTFNVGTDFAALNVTAGDVGGGYMSTAGKIGNKVLASGAFAFVGSLSSANSPQTVTSSNTEWGIEFTVTDPGLTPQVSILNTIVGDGTTLIKTPDLTLIADSTANIFSTGIIVDPGLISSSGGASATAGWKYARFLFTAASHTIIYISGIAARPSLPTAIYWRFIDASSGLLTFGSFTSNTAFSVPVPATAVEFDIDIQAPGDSSAVYANAVVSWSGLVQKIKGNALVGSSAGGGSFDQSLNTTNSVTFAGVTTAALSVLGLPTTSAGAAIGGMWIDTANGNVLKVRTV